MDLEQRTQEIGRELLADAKKRIPAPWTEAGMRNALFDLCMHDPRAATQIFRFLDVFPSLADDEVLPHVREYLLDSGVNLGVLAPIVRLTGVAPQTAIATIRTSAQKMARSFIAGSDLPEALRIVGDREATFDLLGELTTSQEDAKAYREAYFSTLSTLREKNGANAVDSFGKPKTNLSIKLSALDPHFGPIDPEETSKRVRRQVMVIFDRAHHDGAFLNIDMEHYQNRDVTHKVFRDIADDGQYQNVGTVVQAYLKDSELVLDQFIAWARSRKKQVTIRLVKGAYWDHEVKLAIQNGWEIPVFTHKADTDAQYERLAEKMFQYPGLIRGAFATHNLRSAARVLALAENYRADPTQWELQKLWGVGDEMGEALRARNVPVREYVPVGPMIPGMGYFVRRLLENSSNNAFVRALKPDADPNTLLRDPRTVLEEVVRAETPARRRFWTGFSFGKKRIHSLSYHTAEESGFRNYPVANFAREEERAAMSAALANLDSRIEKGLEYSLKIGDEWVETGNYLPSINPAKKHKIIGRAALGTKNHVNAAVKAAHIAQKSWSQTLVEERIGYMSRIADAMARKSDDLAALLVKEAGKTLEEAYADVTEGIDFVNYYALHMKKLAGETRTQKVPGELNTMTYTPLGTFSVIGPFNFWSILVGMTSAALVAGNTVVMKPSLDTPLSGGAFMKICEEAGLPDGVLNYIVCSNEDASPLVESHLVNGIAFTGSENVGKGIYERASIVRDGQQHLKRVILEMGGKDAILVSDSADVDKAVQGVVKSAFGYAGQKCSAASRVIVHERVYDTFVRKLVATTRSLRVGDPADPSTDVNPLISQKAFDKLRYHLDLARTEGGKFLLEGKLDDDIGFYAHPSIVEVTPQHTLAQEEVFAPVLAVMKAQNFDESMDIANGTRFALTAGLYSRTPSEIRRFKKEINAGNAYVNRGITGAIVERQPFGGFKMSGIGSKAGGPDYLKQFLQARVCSENMDRSGHVPEMERYLK